MPAVRQILLKIRQSVACRSRIRFACASIRAMRVPPPRNLATTFPVCRVLAHQGTALAMLLRGRSLSLVAATSRLNGGAPTRVQR
ncbi:MAG: hypothetical protein B7Z41_08785 [Rhizobiales bacterium 12-66-7]|nr:MAG: hypothetical protein B7Z41_08785 [Rhizobiales bacterium 12-66-7]